MHLIELKEKLDAIQAVRGNVALSHALVMHRDETLVTFSDEETARELSEAMAAQLAEPGVISTIVEAEGVFESLEERLEAAGPVGLVTVTGMELLQLLEYRAECQSFQEVEGDDPPIDPRSLEPPASENIAGPAKSEV